MNEREGHLNRVANDFGSLVSAQRAMEHQFAAYTGNGRTLPINAKLAVQNSSLLVAYLDKVAEALPRPVIVDGELGMEYVFRLRDTLDGTPLWRFYLVRESSGATPVGKYGLFSGSSDDGRRFYDHDNERFPAMMAMEVCEAILASAEMRPSDLEGSA